MTSHKAFNWQLLIMAGLGTYVFLIAITIPYMWFYGQFTDPGQEMPYYSERANQMIPPLIFCLAPFVMYIVSRWLCERVGQQFYLYACLYFLTQEVADGLLVAFSGNLATFYQPSIFVVYAAKLLGAIAGAYFASKAQQLNNAR
ncbi:MAG: hypothetical protein GKR91_09330 [Pseudomonadales bacterium]|nr:hypothetical protein [Pseudomonadales bacterium]